VSFQADLAGIPEQLEAELQVEGGTLPPDVRLILGGMGGSAAAGDFFQLHLTGRREVRVLREPTLPDRVDPRTALIVLSYSGETDESLSLWSDARARGLPRAVVTSGGTLARTAEEESCPRVLLPGGLAPRNALGYLLGGLRCLAGVPESASEWTEARVHLISIRKRVEDRHREWSQIAELLESSHVPVLLAGDAFSVSAARRWRASLAENAKVAATVWELPEAAHNRIVTAGRDGPRRRSLGLFALGTPRESRARARWEAVLAALEAQGAKPFRVNVPHALPWVEALGLAYLGDWMSIDLAQRLGVDPEPITLMTDVKSRLRQGKESAS
jgi:glucose/mannose-6-phosphate isomerase